MSRGQDFAFAASDDIHDEFDFGPLVLVQSQNQTGIHQTMDEEFELSDLSDEQEIILSVLQVCSAILSLIGSCTIVFKILRSLSRNQSTTPYDRIILGLSICDIVSSCTYAMGPFLLPRETSQRVWVFGNASTCQKLGFLTQLSCLWALWYNALLSFYYLLTVRFQVKRQDFCRKYEIWMHLSGAIFFPLTALIGYIGDWYGEQALSMSCWVREVPTGCDDSGTCTGDSGEYVAYIFGAIPMVFTFLSLIINNVIIYIFVRKSLLPSPSSITRDCITTTEIENNESNNEIEDSAELQTIQHRLAKEAATQGFLYVSTFLLTATPIFILQVLDGSLAYEEDDQGRIYPLLVLNSMLLPLQGFFNVFIYAKPSYSRFGAAYPEKSKWFVLKQALFDPNIPRLTSTVGISSVPTLAGDQKHSEKNGKCGSNFSMSLDNIIEEDGSVVESFSTESKSQSASDSRESPPLGKR